MYRNHIWGTIRGEKKAFSVAIETRFVIVLSPARNTRKILCPDNIFEHLVKNKIESLETKKDKQMIFVESCKNF